MIDLFLMVLMAPLVILESIFEAVMEMIAMFVFAFPEAF